MINMSQYSRLDIDSEEPSTKSSNAKNSSTSRSKDEVENLGKFPKSKVRILLVEVTGHGKSSLINKMVSKDVAKVGGGATATQHEVIN